MQSLKAINRLLPLSVLALAGGLGADGAMAQTSGTQTVSGIVSVIHGDPADVSSRPLLDYYVVDERDRTSLIALTLSDTQIRSAGGPEALAGQRVTVQGVTEASSPESLRWHVESLTIAPTAPAASVGTASAISGNRRVLNILCKFADIADEPRDTGYFNALVADEYPGLGHYWGENSANTVNLRGSFSVGWFTLPEARARYLTRTASTEWPLRANLLQLKKDCRGQAESAGLDTSRFAVLNMMFNGPLDGAAWGGRDMSTGQGVTWLDGRFDHALVAHEMGHALGLHHSAWPGNAGPWEITFDVMDEQDHGFRYHETFGRLGLHLNAYHKDLLGWTPSAAKFTLPAGSTRTLTLERSALPFTANYRMIRIPTTSGRFYTVEARREIGYDKGDGVIVHEVDPQRADTPALLMGGFFSTAFRPGQTFESSAADAVTVRVDSATQSGYVVTVTSGIKPLTVSIAGKGKVTGQGIACGTGTSGNCGAAYTPGQLVTLSATAFVNTHIGEMWTFDHWEGACTGTAPTCQVTMSAARSVRAAFVE